MPRWSRYAGQAIANNGRHSIAAVEPIADDAACVTFDYFRHEGADWRAVAPVAGVRDVSGQTYNFSAPKTRKGENGPETLFRPSGLPRRKIPILNHVQCRFLFADDQPVRLYPNGGPTSGEPAHTLHDIIYSAEATGPEGVLFNLRDAVMGNMVCAHRLLSTQEMVFERVAVEGQYVVESAPLALKPDEQRRLLTRALQRSNRAGMDEPYYMLRLWGTNNCTSNPLEILDEVVSYDWLHWLGATLYRLPLSPRFYLRLRGLDSDPSFRKFLRVEFADYLNDPATRRRRRDHVKQAIADRRKAQGRGR
ncbi:lipoprotein N-acyltransferase Lnb domain-containing protein [Posidoniimonas polymericola]|nr:DUF4105 domain-containing protein [Posidoniimonas polymericola]